MAIDVKQYMEQLAQTAGLSPEEKDAILKVATTNEKFSKALGDDVLRQQDYSRNMDALRKKEQESVEYYVKLRTWENEVKANAEKLAAYEATYGDLNGQRQTVQQVQPDLTAFEKKWRDDMAAELSKRDGQVIGLLKDMGKIASAHAVEFKEALDTDALEKVAMERNLPLKQAYEELVRARRDEKSAEARKHEIQQAREEGARDALSKHHLPVDAPTKEFHPFFNPGDAKQQVEYTSKDGRLSPTAERQLRSNFVDEWNKAGQSTSGT